MSYGTDKPIIIWAHNKYIEIINKAIEQYQNIDSGILFEVVEKIPNEIEQELDVLIATQQELPNIILVNDQEIERLIKKYPSLFSNLDDYIDKSAFREFKAKNITFRGSIYACPCSNDQEALFYRKDILNYYLASEELPEELTWEEYIELGVQLKERGFNYFLPPVHFLAESILQSTGKLYYNSKGVISSNNVYETLSLIDNLLENELVFPMNTIDMMPILDLISNDQLFSIIGTSNLFTRIKELVENNNLTQEWGVTKLPKNETFCYDVNLGGCSFMVVNNEEVDDQYYVYDFLTQIFANDTDESCNFYNEVAEYYDMVPSTNYMVNKLNDLDNDGCFYNQQVIKFLYDLSEDVPPIHFGEFDEALGNEFQDVVNDIANGTLSVGEALSKFEDICKDYYDLDIPPELDYIVVETPPDKTIYYEYEEFDRTGMVVRAYFVDGTTSIVKGYTVSPNTLSAGTTCVVVSYSSGGVTATDEQSITVYTRTVISIEASPRKQYYLQTDTLSTNDFRVEATFDVGSKNYITEYEISPSTLNQTGNQVVTITYQKRGVICSCDVTIEVKRKLTSIGVITPPLMVNYIEGQYFNPTGMQVKAYYSDQTSDIINQYSYTPTTPLEYSEFPQEVQIRYVENGVECETIQSIMVEKRKLEKIEIENILVDNYIVGQYLSQSSVIVRAYYNDETSERIKDFEIKPVGSAAELPLEEEDTEIEVRYTEDDITKTATYSITINPKILTSIMIKRRPYKLIYENITENNINLSGLILSMNFNNKVWVDFNYDIYLSNKTSIEEEENNQNLIDGSDIYCTLDEKEENEERTVTIKYKETISSETIFKEAQYVVYNRGTSLQTMYISKQPNKRRYYVGEKFNSAGMIVKGNFLDKTSTKPNVIVDNITSFCHIDEKPIGPQDQYAYIYYKDDNGKISNHTRVAITVNEKNVDNSRKGQTELTYRADSGTASVNLFNRRLSFKHFDTSIGKNTYTISCSHIYNSLFNEQHSLKYGPTQEEYYKTGMGKGFKLTLQQYLIFDETYGRYIYIDSAGYRHYFVSLGDGVRYYDTTGTNLLLKKVKNKDIYKIYDLSGNKMYFENGVIVKSVSCFKNNYAKIYEYDNGKLIKVYDKRKPSNTILFEYDNETNLLSTIKCTKDDITKKELTFSYKTIGNEYCLEKIINGDITTIFKYNNNKELIYAYNEQTLSCLEFKYIGATFIQEITSGTIDNNGKNIPRNQIIQKNVIESSNDGYIITVRNQKKSYRDNATDVVMEYNFNAKGYTVSILERNLGNSNQLKTLEKEPGIQIDFPNESAPKLTINTQNTYKYEEGRMCYSTAEYQMLEKLSKYRHGKYANSENFTIQFWAKLKYVLNDPEVLVTIKSTIVKTYYNEGKVSLDNSAIGVWQLVSVPIKIDGENMKEVTISMALNFWQGFEICNVKLYPSSASSLTILSQYKNTLNMNNANKIIYTRANDQLEVKKSINEEHFMTQNDLKYTILNMYKTSKNNTSSSDSFILSMCDCTKKVWVKKADLEIESDGSTFRVPIGLEENNDEKSYLALYEYSMETTDSGVTTSNLLAIYDALTISNYTGPVIKGMTIATPKEKKPKISRIISYADFMGRILQEKDEYGVITTYYYNTSGEIVETTISHSETKETIEYTSYGSDTETVEKTKISYDKIEYNNPLGYVESTTYNGYNDIAANALNQTFVYNDFKTRVKRIFNNLNGKNVLTYDNNRLSEITPTEYSTNTDYGYKIEYDRYGNPYKYYLLSGTNGQTELLTENELNYQEGTIVNKRYRTSETESDNVIMNINKYGKTSDIIESSNGDSTKRTNIKYQTLEESSGVAKVDTVEDPYEQRTYTYSYDEYNRCTGYEAISPLGNFSVKQTGPNEVTYFNKSYEKETYITEYDSSVQISPRITSTQCSNSLWFNYYLVSYYGYDWLGRLGGKVVLNAEGWPVSIENTYLPGTLLKEKIEIKLGYEPENAYLTYHNTYDNRGRITEINASQTNCQEFNYDKANHLITEKLVSGNTTTYEYNIDGSIKSETTNNDANTKVNYIYEKGRLVQKGNQNYTYDHIGNCLTYNGKNLVWHRGSLLKQYDTTTYSYDNQGIRFRKQKDGKTTIFFHDGGKIVDELRIREAPGGPITNRISYIYDTEGISGFWYNGQCYIYIKDGLGNVRAILRQRVGSVDHIASYDYDAWGNCTITSTPNEIIDEENIAEINPIRWKSQYYDAESGLYYINGRYYSPETKQYLSAQNVETVLSSATTIYGLNLYIPTITNPLDIAPNEYTIETVTELAYDPPEPGFWKWLFKSTGGKIIATLFAVSAMLASLLTGNLPAFFAAAASLIGALAIKSIVAGIQSMVKGNSFWKGLESYINNNWAQSVAIDSVTLILSMKIDSIITIDSDIKEIYKTYDIYKYYIKILKRLDEGNPNFTSSRERLLMNEAKYNHCTYSDIQLECMIDSLAPQDDCVSMQLYQVNGRGNLYSFAKLTTTYCIS